MKGDYAALAARISQSVIDLQRVVGRAELLMEKAKVTGDDGFLDGVALNLHGIERIFEDIARTIDNSVPAGPGWHHDLLLQMAAAVNAVRPPVISLDTRSCLEEYRGFRHVVRNVYTFNLRSSVLEDLCKGIGGCFLKVKEDLQGFVEFIERVISDF